ncbi:MAG: Ig-like domain-containing protein [Chloroflexota bacterium]|nr:Ig-like domain-containing protein [Chloroflexota bacterium]
MLQRLTSLLSALLLVMLASSAVSAAGITSSQEQQRALSEVNRYRAMAKQAPAAAAWSLNSAAWGHARYMVKESDYDHWEDNRSSQYYIGYQLRDRATKYGYSNDSLSENVLSSWVGSMGTRTYLQVDNAVQWWLGAIYHRFPILNPHTQHIGYGGFRGYTGSSAVLDFGGSYSLTGPVTRWPVPNQTGVGVQSDNEWPDPLVQFGGHLPGGYPVSLIFWRGDVKYTSITMVRASDGLAVPGYRLSPRNDEPEPGMTFHKWNTALTFIPRNRLDYSTKYTVTFKGVYAANGNLSTGQAFTYTWSFTTMPAPGRLVRSTPAEGSRDVSRTPNVTLSFDQPVRSYTLVRTAYKGGLDSSGVGLSLRRASDGAEVGFTVTPPAGATTKTVSLTPSSTLAANTTYHLTFRLADAWGRTVYDSIWFTTGS